MLVSLFLSMLETEDFFLIFNLNIFGKQDIYFFRESLNSTLSFLTGIKCVALEDIYIFNLFCVAHKNLTALNDTRVID